MKASPSPGLTPPLVSVLAPAPTFRYACEDCAYFVDDVEACAHGYPTGPHRRQAPLLVFCKEFELL
jgi:hypothetical protein